MNLDSADLPRPLLITEGSIIAAGGSRRLSQSDIIGIIVSFRWASAVFLNNFTLARPPKAHGISGANLSRFLPQKSPETLRQRLSPYFASTFTSNSRYFRTSTMTGGNRMGLIEQIQAWYIAQCDGDWEHQYGISIETLDNPGWRVIVDLSGTSLENISFQTYQEDKGEEGWIFCEVSGNKFVGRGDAGKLQ